MIASLSLVFVVRVWQVEALSKSTSQAHLKHPSEVSVNEAKREPKREAQRLVLLSYTARERRGEW